MPLRGKWISGTPDRLKAVITELQGGGGGGARDPHRNYDEIIDGSFLGSYGREHLA
jgi:hypothetical protein